MPVDVTPVDVPTVDVPTVDVPDAIVPLIAPTVVESNVLPRIEPRPARRQLPVKRGPGRSLPVSRGFLIALVLLLLFGVVGGALLWRSGTGGNSKTPGGSPTPAGASATVGARLVDWIAKHPSAPGYPAGTAFVSAPGIPVQAGQPGARYTNLFTTNGFISAFRFNLPAGSTVSTATFALKGELPADSTLVDARSLGTCEIAHYTSATLGNLFGAANQSGSIVVVFRSPTVTFDSSHLAFADVSATSNIPDHC